MWIAISGRKFPDGTAPEDQLRGAAAAGFAGLELALSAGGALTSTDSKSRYQELGRRAAELDLRITALTCADSFDTNYAAPDPHTRLAARDLTLRLLDRAAAATAGALVVIPAVIGRWNDAAPRVGYANAYACVLDALLELRHDAEARGVALAIENVWNRFLLSPLEAARLLDEVNSPAVGWCLNTGNVAPVGYAADWISTLGGRIVGVHLTDYDVRRCGPEGFCPLGEGSVDFVEVLAALREVVYDGPLTCDGPGEPAELRARIDCVLNDNAQSGDPT